MIDSYEKYVGRVFDSRYRIEKVIGFGGMAIVFKATDLLMRRTVAVKILKDDISGDEESVKRFINESKTVAMLSHQNIVNIYDVSVRDNIKYIVMEFVGGITLKNYMQHRETLNLREIVSYTTQILRALDHAHKKGIVHRDIKPQNIMLLKNGIIRVMDFGIAKRNNADTVTVTDKAIGTVYYISPEQVTGKPIDARSDLYSLGVMMYEMATATLPFTAETPVAVALKQVNEAPVPPREYNPHIPVGLEQIILRAMEKNPEDRYQSAEEMLSQLLKLRENPKIIFKDPRSVKQAQKKAKKRKPSSKSMFPIIMGVTMAFLITAGISGYYILNRLFIDSPMKNYQNITIEEFVSNTYTEALADWFKDSAYYEIPTISYVYDDTVPEGKIVSQDPAPGESRKVLPGKQKCAVTLEISLGKREIVLEDYTVRDYRVVEAEIRKLGLKTSIERVASDVYEIGHVIKTEPESGTVVNENDLIKIYVSYGADPTNTTVPAFVGMNEAEALIKLVESKLSIGKVEYVASSAPAGEVVEQSIEPDKAILAYSSVDFKVSGGKNYDGDGTTLPEPEIETEPETETETETETEERFPFDDPFEDDPFENLGPGFYDDPDDTETESEDNDNPLFGFDFGDIFNRRY